MASRPFSSNTSCSSFSFPIGVTGGLVTRPSSLGSGNYVFYADGAIWDTTNSIFIKPEQTNESRIFVNPANKTSESPS